MGCQIFYTASMTMMNKCLILFSGTQNDGWTQPGGHSWLGRGQTLAQQAQAMSVFSQGIVDESCAAHYGKWGAWRCYLGQYAAPFLEARTLFLQNQIDEWQG